MAREIKPEPVKVDGDTGQIVEETPSLLEIVEKVKGFLEAPSRKKVFFGPVGNQKRYPEIQDWEYIGTFYGITAKTFDPHFVEMGGQKGFHAKAMLLRNDREIGRGEAFCMQDEPVWARKPLFQLASMAQTRALAKAYANLFRHIVVMAGMEGTPWEEMDGIDKPAIPAKVVSQAKIEELGARIIGSAPAEDYPTPEGIEAADEVMSDAIAAKPGPTELEHIKDQVPFPQAPVSEKVPPKKPNLISPAQRKLIFARCKVANLPEAALTAWIVKNYGVETTGLLPWQAMTPLLAWINSFAALPKK